MKKIASMMLLWCATFFVAYADDSIWHLTCLPQEKECRTIWATLSIPKANSTIAIAYNAIKNSQNTFDTNFIINLNDITLAPQQNAISLSGDHSTLSIPIVAKDASGVTAQFTNATTTTQILKLLSNSKTASISFMELNAKNITVITIPLEGFSEQLAKVPHGDRLFKQGL